MRSFQWIGPVIAGAMVVNLFPAAVRADVMTITGVSTGANALPGGGTLGGDNIYHGDDGVSGYIAPQNSTDSYVFTGATLTGGIGGAVIGTDTTATYQGGYGGNGILSQGGSSVTPLVTVNSGTYTGGLAGAATGVGAQLIGGGGGSGLDVNNSTAIVNGGTFLGGNGGTTTDTNSFDYSAGPGLNANFDGIITINDGSFQGGVATQSGSGDGDGILGLGGTVNILGGTFTGGGNGYGINNEAGVITLYGTNFEIDGVATTGDIAGTGTITGTLEHDGTPTSITFNNTEGGTLDLVTVPEPTSIAAMSIGAVALIARRRSGR